VEVAASRESAPHARNLLGCFLFRGDDVFKKVGVLSGGERSRVALVCMLLRPANFLILDEPTNHLDMQSQDVLQRALVDYPGSVLIVSHNRSFLDPLVTKTLEFRPGEVPRLFSGNITYYLEKTAEESGAAKAAGQAGAQGAAAKVSATGSVVSRKDQRRADAEARERRNKLLKPLEAELEVLESKIAEYESAHAALTAALSSPEVSADADKLRETSNAVARIGGALENSYSRWGELSDEIERVKVKLGIEE
jgi:ATP-binding cassette, subfamily F, member 3